MPRDHVPTPIPPTPPESVVRASVDRVGNARRIRWTDDALAYLHAHAGATYQELRSYARLSWKRDFPTEHHDQRLAEMDRILSELWLNRGMPPVPTPPAVTERFSLWTLVIVALVSSAVGGIVGTIDTRRDLASCEITQLHTCAAWVQEEFR